MQISGIGLYLQPRVLAAVRVAFPPTLREWSLWWRFAASERPPPLTPSVVVNVLTETALQAIRQVTARVQISMRDIFAAGLLEPAYDPCGFDWTELAARLAEQTGCTVIHSLRQRDRAAGGCGRLITALADYLLCQNNSCARLLIHLGHFFTILYLPAGNDIKNVFGFEVGPGNYWLDALLYYGTRCRESCDHGGKRAVQGRCHEDLLRRWLEHPYLMRRPPKVVAQDTFGKSFLRTVFMIARNEGMTLADLLCTATHWVVQATVRAVRQWLPTDAASLPVYASGGGCRNGFLWQLLSQHFEQGVHRTDELGVPGLARSAAAAAILAALTCDGVAGQFPYLTGAHGARWLGSFCPGDPRHWSRLSAWIADQTRDLALLRAA
ncbi:MAG: anhydro-N-acetylmuramic acid kinase [Gemmataceae bacterium]|nr:anhydro-N-acetylmuramic acid kinase [Gemmataceae bacterium]MDW8243873.1 anhydro-N-acetylmuramic acid kinase [Thermogemmata sp.]